MSASTLSVTYASSITVVETFTGDYIDSRDATVTISGLSETGTLTAATSVPVTKQSSGRVALSGGTGSLDFTALPGLTPEEIVDGTGLKVQWVKVRNLSTNANSITVAKGASNGLGINAAGTTFSIPISPGQSVLIFGDDAGPDISAGACVWDVTGTLVQELEFHVVLG